LKKNFKNQDGQSTIEFIFTFAFGVSIIFLVFNASINYVSGYLTHYATFMASRAFLTDDPGLTEVRPPTETLAREVFNQYALSVFNVSSDGFRINMPVEGDADQQLTVGAVTVYNRKIDIVGQVTGQKQIEMVSESFLGKEPTRAQCVERVCFAITGGQSCNIGMDITMYDDGC
jgi:hypothetical protein